MEYDAEAKIRGSLLDLPDDRSHLLPLRESQGFTSIHRNPPRNLPSLRRLAVGENEQSGTQRREQLADPADMVDYLFYARRLRDRHGNERRKHGQSAAAMSYSKPRGRSENNQRVPTPFL